MIKVVLTRIPWTSWSGLPWKADSDILSKCPVDKSQTLVVSPCRVTGGELFEDIVAREYYSEADARWVVTPQPPVPPPSFSLPQPHPLPLFPDPTPAWTCEIWTHLWSGKFGWGWEPHGWVQKDITWLQWCSHVLLAPVVAIMCPIASYSASQLSRIPLDCCS